MGRTSAKAKMQRNAAAMKRDRGDALSEMNAATRRKLKKIEKMLGDTREMNLRFYHELGYELLVIAENVEKYGRRAYKQITAALPLHKRTLRFARAFARDISTDEFEFLVRLRDDAMGFQLHWGHMQYLLTQNTQALRRKWAERAVKYLWDPKTLHANMQHEEGSKGAPGGRPHKLPATVHMQIRQIQQFCHNWAHKAEYLWNGDEDNVFANIQDEPPESFSMLDLENLEKIIEDLPRMRELIGQMRPLAVQARNHVCKILEDRAAEEAARREEEVASGKESRAIELDGNDKPRRRRRAVSA